jgi:RNA polymerase sigma-70 factor (ECF subfamily)
MNIADSGYFNPAEDYEIVQQILGGNKDLFEKLERKYKKPLSHLISKMVRNTDDVEDIVQETFIRAYNNLRYYKKEFAFHSWLFKIASNLCIDFLRKRRVQTISIEQPFPRSESENQMDFPALGDEADKMILDEEQRQSLNAALSFLPEKYRIVIELRHFEELEYNEIAERLGIPVGTVKAHLFRARKALLDILRKRRLV